MCKRILLVLLIFFAFLAGCGGDKEPVNPATVTTPAKSPGEMKWTYQTNAISFTVVADKNLNEYEGTHHTLLLCFYQLSTLKAFNEMARTSSGIEKLLNGTDFDPSVTLIKREFIRPGTNATLIMDRAEGTQYVGVAAGYYDVQGSVTRSWQIPMDVSSTGMLWWGQDWYAPAKLEAMIVLGPHTIQKVGE